VFGDFAKRSQLSRGGHGDGFCETKPIGARVDMDSGFYETKPIGCFGQIYETKPIGRGEAFFGRLAAWCLTFSLQ